MLSILADIREEKRQPDHWQPPSHTEAVEAIPDLGRTSYRDILEFFFQIHWPDLGEGIADSDYRSD